MPSQKQNNFKNFRVSFCWVFIANFFFSSHRQSVLQSTAFQPGCPSHFQVSNRKRKCQPFYLLVLFLELSGRCGASSRRSCGNVTFGVDGGVVFFCIKRSVSSVTTEHEDRKGTRKKRKVTMEKPEKPKLLRFFHCYLSFFFLCFSRLHAP